MSSVTMTHLSALKIHIVIPNLKVDADQVYQRDVVTGVENVLEPHNIYKRCSSREQVEMDAYTSILVVEHAIMSLIAIRNKPPVSEDQD
jgi:hypothetical protein